MPRGIKLWCYFLLGVFKIQANQRGKTTCSWQWESPKWLWFNSLPADHPITMILDFSRPMVLCKMSVWIWLLKKVFCKLCIIQKLVISKCGAMQDISFSSRKKHMKKLFYFSIVRHERGNQFLMFHKPQSKAPCFSSFMLAWMGCEWQIQSWTNPSILERKTEIREAAKTPPTPSHLSSS